MRKILGFLAALLFAGPAWATCSAVPFIFSPGTTALSGQVNADLAALVACINALNGSQITTGTIQNARLDLTTLLTALSGLPHKANNSALAATNSTAFTTVIRDGFATPGDGGAAVYTSSNVACTLNAGAGDNGSQVQSADAKCWIADFGGRPASALVWGVKCDGVTNDSAAFQKAVTGYSSIVLPPGLKTCLVTGLTLGAETVLDCQGSGMTADITAATLHTPMITRTGAHQRMLHCYVDDPNSYTLNSTTLSGNAAIGAVSVTVTSATGIQVNQPIGIKLDSGITHVTKVTSVVGATIGILDAIPSSATSVAINGAGISGYSVNDALVANGGVGPPLTMKVSAVNGGNQVTGVTIQAPGMYSTIPTAPLTVSDTNTNGITAQGATFTPTYAGATAGKAVKTAWGLITSIGANEGTIDDLRMGLAPVGMAYYPTDRVTTQSEGEALSNFILNSNSLVGLFIDTSVNTLKASNGFVWGTVAGGLPTGSAGLYRNAENPSALATGGDSFVNVNVLQFETEWLMRAAQLENMNGSISDTTKYYGIICDACANMIMVNTYASFSGPGLPSTAGYGVGMWIGHTSLNIELNGLMAGLNASDLHLDGTSSIFLAQGSMLGAFAPGQKITGSGGSLFTGQQFAALNTGGTPVGGGGTTIYLGQSSTAASATELNVLWRNPLYNTRLSDFVVSVPVAPGAGNSYVATLRINAVDSPLTCTISNASFGCELSSPLLALAPGDSVSVKVVSSGGAPANQFFVWGRQQ